MTNYPIQNGAVSDSTSTYMDQSFHLYNEPRYSKVHTPAQLFRLRGGLQILYIF